MSELADRQAALIAALVAGAPAPDGFDAGRLAATRRALLRKRAGEAKRAWPALAASLGPEWPAVFARDRDGHAPVGPVRDGWDVARALRAGGELSPSAAAELTEREKHWRYDGTSAPVLRWGARLRRALTATSRTPHGGLRNSP